LEKILSEIEKIRSSSKKYKPVFLKISPDLNDKQIDETLNIINKTGIDGIVVSNTTITRNNLKSSINLINKIGQGGMSGQPIRKRATEMIAYIHKKTKGKLPIIGVGGIMNADDAIEKLRAGASLIQIYTGFIYEGPGLVRKINKAILKELI
jgi:dihydroorotate dehydrogenase